MDPAGDLFGEPLPDGVDQAQRPVADREMMIAVRRRDQIKPDGKSTAGSGANTNLVKRKCKL